MVAEANDAVSTVSLESHGPRSERESASGFLPTNRRGIEEALFSVAPPNMAPLPVSSIENVDLREGERRGD